jgi:hypothetical protein
MKNLSTDPITDGPRLTSVEQRFFDGLAKEAAEEKTAPETNEDDTVDATELMADEDPEPSTENTSEARWSQETGKVVKGQQPEPRFSSAAKAQMIQGREKMLGELFSHEGKKPGQEKVAMETVGQRAKRITGL